ncbi:MAG: WG repeat-containing protein [Cyanobacteriota bacterium]
MKIINFVYSLKGLFICTFAMLILCFQLSNAFCFAPEAKTLFFDEVKSFSEGLAAVKLDEKWGYIDYQGNTVIKPQFLRAESFSEGLANVVLVENNQYINFYIDKDGHKVHSNTYNVSFPYYNGLAGTIDYDKNKIVLLNKEGKPVYQTNAKFKSFDFSDDGYYCLRNTDDNDIRYIDNNGHEVIKTNYEWGKAFNEGLAAVKVNGHWGFINEKGEMSIKPIYDSAFSFNEGLAAVRKEKKYGFIDKKGHLVINFKYDFVNSFRDNLAPAKINGKWGFINKQGEFVIDPKFEDEKITPDYYDKTHNLDSQGGAIIVPTETIYSFSEGLKPVNIDGKWGFINKSESLIINALFDKVYSFHEGYSAVKINAKWTFIDKNGNYLTRNYMHSNLQYCIIALSI